MKKFEAVEFGLLFVEVTGSFVTAGRGGKYVGVMPQEEKDEVLKLIIKPAESLCQQADLRESEKMINRLKTNFNGDLTFEEFKYSLGNLGDLIQSEMSKRHFLSLTESEANCYEAQDLFGKSVTDAFPSATMDIQEAGNCLACARYNAAVYHLMGAAEVGLRVLAWDRRVLLKKDAQPLPLELAQWGELINALDGRDGRINLIKKWKHSLRREQAMQFYNSAIVEARAFNDGYRRHAAHARGTIYSPEETTALMGHVKRFLTTLAKVMTEAKRSPNVWTKDAPSI